MRSVIFPTVAALIAAAGLLQAQVAGTVVEQGSGQPVAEAIVTLQATSVRTTTGPLGDFALPGAVGVDMVIVAAKKGFYNASVTVSSPANQVLLVLDVVPVGNNPNYPFVPPVACGSCHPDQIAQWSDSPMSQTGSNAWVYDVYNGTGTPGGMGGFVYTRDSSHFPQNPHSECASCHQPEPWIAQPFSPLEPLGNLSAGAMHGVSCEVCHKVAHIDETSVNFPGIWPGVVEFNRPIDPVLDQVQYGVLGDTSFGIPGRTSYQPQLTAAMCASCHQDKNDPDDDGNFEEPNGVISEPTYLEWLATPYADPASPLAATCVDCHMPAYGATEVAQVPPPIPYQAPQRDPSTVRSHRIEGTTPQFLQNAVDLAVSGDIVGSSLEVDVAVTNSQAGHHVPTGTTIRNMILIVEAWRQEGGVPLVSTGSQVIHDLGGVGDPSQGNFAGLPGKLYAKVNHDASGSGPVFFTEATGIQFDSRIPALATDATHYSFQLPAGGGTFRVRARLIYRRAFKFLADAKQWSLDGHGNPLADVQPPHFGFPMEERVTLWTLPGGTGVAPFGAGCSGLVSGWSGMPTLGSPDFYVTLLDAPAFRPAFLIGGTSNTSWGGVGLPHDLGPAGAPGCALLVAPEATSFALTDGTGTVAVHAPILGPASLVGLTVYTQWAVVTPQNAFGLVLSDALAITIQ